MPEILFTNLDLGPIRVGNEGDVADRVALDNFDLGETELILEILLEGHHDEGYFGRDEYAEITSDESWHVRDLPEWDVIEAFYIQRADSG